MNIHDITIINKYIVKLENEPQGFLAKSNLQFALSEFNYNKRLNTLQRIAILTRGIAEGHTFIEGNKRTAIIVLNTLLKINKLKLTLTKKQQEDFIIRVARGKYNNITKFSNYLKRNTKQL